MLTMKIGIDVFGCEHGKSGLGSYVSSLVKNLPFDENCTYELFGHEIDRYTFDPGDGRVTFRGIDIPDNAKAEKIWHTFKLKSFIAKQKYDAVLFPSGSPAGHIGCKTPTVVVVHDIVSNSLEKSTNKISVGLFKRNLKRASKVIAVSQFIRKDLAKLKINPEKIEVIYDGVDHALSNNKRRDLSEEYDSHDDIAYIQPFAIKRPYITYASRIVNSDKKHIELIDAFSDFKKRTGLPHRLVLAGNEEAYAKEVYKKLESCEYASDILITGHFPRESFYDLYSLSEACVFPSINEGVGLPVIEAMACGVPVACSKKGSLGEIAGDFALYFDPDNGENFSAAIEKIVTDEVLREKLKRDGIEWTKRFSWDKTAQRTVDLLKSLIK